MNAEIICVGTELVLGDIVNTNAQYISQKLASMGIDVFFQSAVGDNPKRLKQVLSVAVSRSNMIILTGGLGPTQDDLTIKTVCEAIEVPLELNTQALERIKAHFAKTGKEMTENNIKQAMVPQGATVFQNDVGTAPGCAIQAGEQVMIFLPGPPFEMKAMLDGSVSSYLAKFADGITHSVFINIFGYTESKIDEMAKDLFESLNPTVAPYAKSGETQLRVTAKAENERAAKALCNSMVHEIRERFQEAVYGVDADSLQQVTVQLLQRRKMTLATAESCTAGYISKRITDISGSSEVFLMGATTYSNESKNMLLGVPMQLIEQKGAVCAEVAAAMAKGVRTKSGADIGIGITGIAGPASDDSGKPVGLVYIALSDKDGEYVIECKNGGQHDREYIRFASASEAINLLRLYLISKPLMLKRTVEIKGVLENENIDEKEQTAMKDDNLNQQDLSLEEKMIRDIIGGKTEDTLPDGKSAIPDFAKVPSAPVVPTPAVIPEAETASVTDDYSNNIQSIINGKKPEPAPVSAEPEPASAPAEPEAVSTPEPASAPVEPVESVEPAEPTQTTPQLDDIFEQIIHSAAKAPVDEPVSEPVKPVSESVNTVDAVESFVPTKTTPQLDDILEQIASSTAKAPIEETVPESSVSASVEPEEAADNEENTKDESKTSIEKPKKKKKNFFSSIFPWKGDSGKEVVRKIVFLVAVVTLIVMLWQILSYVLDPFFNNRKISELQSIYHNSESIRYSSSVMNPKFDELYKKNPDLAGWISIDNTTIDYPVLRAEDNDKYYRNGFDGSNTRLGSIFMDYRSSFSYGNESKNIVIYGHNVDYKTTDDSVMFGQLPRYRTLAYYQQHPTINMDTLYNDGVWKIFSVMTTNAYAAQDNGNLFDFRRRDFGNDEDFLAWIDECKVRSCINANVDVMATDTIMTLQTCVYDFSEARLVVMARRVRDDELATVDTATATLNDTAKYPQAWYDAKGIDNPYKDGNLPVVRETIPPVQTVVPPVTQPAAVTVPAPTIAVVQPTAAPYNNDDDDDDDTDNNRVTAAPTRATTSKSVTTKKPSTTAKKTTAKTTTTAKKTTAKKTTEPPTEPPTEEPTEEPMG